MKKVKLGTRVAHIEAEITGAQSLDPLIHRRFGTTSPRAKLTCKLTKSPLPGP